MSLKGRTIELDGAQHVVEGQAFRQQPPGGAPAGFALLLRAVADGKVMHRMVGPDEMRVVDQKAERDARYRAFHTFENQPAETTSGKPLRVQANELAAEVGMSIQWTEEPLAISPRLVRFGWRGDRQGEKFGQVHDTSDHDAGRARITAEAMACLRGLKGEAAAPALTADGIRRMRENLLDANDAASLREDTDRRVVAMTAAAAAAAPLPPPINFRNVTWSEHPGRMVSVVAEGRALEEAAVAAETPEERAWRAVGETVHLAETALGKLGSAFPKAELDLIREALGYSKEEIGAAARAEGAYEMEAKVIPGIKNAYGRVEDFPTSTAWRSGFVAGHVKAARVGAAGSLAAANARAADLDRKLNEAHEQIAAWEARSFERALSDAREGTGSGAFKRQLMRELLADVDKVTGRPDRGSIPANARKKIGDALGLTPTLDDYHVDLIVDVAQSTREALEASLAEARKLVAAVTQALGAHPSATATEIAELVKMARDDNKALGEARNKAADFAAQICEAVGLPSYGVPYERIIARVREVVTSDETRSISFAINLARTDAGFDGANIRGRMRDALASWAERMATGPDYAARTLGCDTEGAAIAQRLDEAAGLRSALAQALGVSVGTSDAELVQHAKNARSAIGVLEGHLGRANEAHGAALNNVARLEASVAGAREEHEANLDKIRTLEGQVMDAVGFRADVATIIGVPQAGCTYADDAVLGALRDVKEARDVIAVRRLDWLLRVVRAAGLARDFYENEESIGRVEKELRQRINACSDVDRLRTEVSEAREAYDFLRLSTGDRIRELTVRLDRELSAVSSLSTEKSVAERRLKESEANAERLEAVWRGYAAEQEAVLEKLAAAGLGSGRLAPDRQRAILAGIDVLIANAKSSEERAVKLFEERNKLAGTTGRVNELNEQINNAWDHIEKLRPKRDDLGHADEEFDRIVGTRRLNTIDTAVRGLCDMFDATERRLTEQVGNLHKELEVSNDIEAGHALSAEARLAALRLITVRLRRIGLGPDFEETPAGDDALQLSGWIGRALDVIAKRADVTLSERPLVERPLVERPSSAHLNEMRSIYAKLVGFGAAMPEGALFDQVLAGIDWIGKHRDEASKSAAAWANAAAGYRTGDSAGLDAMIGAPYQARVQWWRTEMAKVLGISQSGTLPLDAEIMNEAARQRNALEEARSTIELINAAHEAGVRLWRHHNPTHSMVLPPVRNQLVTWLLGRLHDMAITREHAIELARVAAFETTPRPWYVHGDPAAWMPHEWVIAAIQGAHVVDPVVASAWGGTVVDDAPRTSGLHPEVLDPGLANRRRFEQTVHTVVTLPPTETRPTEIRIEVGSGVVEVPVGPSGPGEPVGPSEGG
jgi:hypothetical protein